MRLLVGVIVLATLTALVWAGSMAARPDGRAAWAGPARGGIWLPTRLTVQTNALLAVQQPPGLLLAGTDNGVWRSTDGGAHWTMDGAGLRGNTIVSLAATRNAGMVLAGSTDGAVYKQDGRGAGPWRRVSPSLDATPVYSLAIGPNHEGIVLVGTEGAVFRGTATGASWRWRRVARTGDAAISAIAWSAGDAASALAAVFGISPPVLATSDGGLTWHAARAGLPAVLPTQALLALAAPRPQVILTTMGGGVWSQSPGGQWRDISAGLPERHAMPLVALPGAGATVLYAGTMGDGVYVKQGGADWQPLGRGLTGIANTILGLAVTTGPRPALVAATANGVFRYSAPSGT